MQKGIQTMIRTFQMETSKMKRISRIRNSQLRNDWVQQRRSRIFYGMVVVTFALLLAYLWSIISADSAGRYHWSSSIAGSATENATENRKLPPRLRH